MSVIRKKIGLGDSPASIIATMSEGNPGALSVLIEMLKKDQMNLIAMLDLDDMDMRGAQIWVGYKDHCGQDLDKFIAACRARDADMIETVNRECPFECAAVTGGASFRR